MNYKLKETIVQKGTTVKETITFMVDRDTRTITTEEMTNMINLKEKIIIMITNKQKCENITLENTTKMKEKNRTTKRTLRDILHNT